MAGLLCLVTWLSRSWLHQRLFLWASQGDSSFLLGTAQVSTALSHPARSDVTATQGCSVTGLFLWFVLRSPLTRLVRGRSCKCDLMCRWSVPAQSQNRSMEHRDLGKLVWAFDL